MSPVSTFLCHTACRPGKSSHAEIHACKAKAVDVESLPCPGFQNLMLLRDHWRSLKKPAWLAVTATSKKGYTSGYSSPIYSLKKKKKRKVKKLEGLAPSLLLKKHS